MKIALAESMTGGHIGAMITKKSGASQYFCGGIIAYSNEVKIQVLGIESQLIQKHGVVSEAVAKAMALQTKKLFSSDIALSITGYAGPVGKKVGHFFLGFARDNMVKTIEFLAIEFQERQEIIDFATKKAIELLEKETNLILI